MARGTAPWVKPAKIVACRSKCNVKLIVRQSWSIARLRKHRYYLINNCKRVCIRAFIPIAPVGLLREFTLLFLCCFVNIEDFCEVQNDLFLESESVQLKGNDRYR